MNYLSRKPYFGKLPLNMDKLYHKIVYQAIILLKNKYVHICLFEIQIQKNLLYKFCINTYYILIECLVDIKSHISLSFRGLIHIHMQKSSRFIHVCKYIHCAFWSNLKDRPTENMFML